MFQSTHPRGVRQKTEVSIHGSYQRFNPRTRVGCDPRLCRYFCWVSCFNPRTRVGCDRRPAAPVAGQRPVSIHAPAWGATAGGQCRWERWRCFNPRTRVGCDPRPSRIKTGSICFNPRTRVGCDSHAAFGKLIAFVVSIHAPAWGATPDIPAFTSPISRFNPRTRVGCDHVWGDDMPDEGRFQSTHPRGVRLHPDSPPLGQMGFNPRTRVGCDRASEGRIPISMRFQSTHPRGVRRPANAPVSRASAVSIHAPAWGATIMAATLDEYGRVSIHAPAWGATKTEVSIYGPYQRFNPRTRVGCDQRLRDIHTCLVEVSIHAPAWGATPLTGLQRRAAYVSIHAPAWGATLHLTPGRTGKSRFNPRTRVGCDPKKLTRTIPNLGFNPRTRVGCDVIDHKDRFFFFVSIHAPAWGATIYTPESLPAHCGFNPRTRVGCDKAWGA